MIKRLFCKHSYSHVRNIHGDEIRHAGWKRSIWECVGCGKIKLENALYYDKEAK